MEMLKAEMDDIYVPWIDNVSKETNERVRKLFVKFYETGAKKELVALEGDNLPEPEAVEKLSPEESMAALMEDVQRFGFMMDIGFYGEAEYTLGWIMHCIKSKKYDVDEETVKQLLEAIDAKMNREE